VLVLRLEVGVFLLQLNDLGEEMVVHVQLAHVLAQVPICDAFDVLKRLVHVLEAEQLGHTHHDVLIEVLDGSHETLLLVPTAERRQDEFALPNWSQVGTKMSASSIVLFFAKFSGVKTTLSVLLISYCSQYLRRRL
jgi:hypothetical protein